MTPERLEQIRAMYANKGSIYYQLPAIGEFLDDADKASPISDVAKDLQRRPRVGSAVILRNNGCVLMGQRCKDPYRGYWVIPGGGIMPNETMRHAAIREIKEETNLDIHVIEHFGTYEFIGDIHIIVNFFIGIYDPTQLIIPGDDTGDLKWVDRFEFNQLLVTPLNTRVFADLLTKGYLA